MLFPGNRSATLCGAVRKVRTPTSTMLPNRKVPLWETDSTTENKPPRV